MIRYSSILLGFVLVIFCYASAQAPAGTPPATMIDGGAGQCSLELTVLMPDGKPAAAADVKVHIAYGFGGFHKLDLEAGASQDGKVKFTGLPARVRRPPLEFRATKDKLTAIAKYDPTTECQAQHSVTLSASSAE